MEHDVVIFVSVVFIMLSRRYHLFDEWDALIENLNVNSSKKFSKIISLTENFDKFIFGNHGVVFFLK